MPDLWPTGKDLLTCATCIALAALAACGDSTVFFASPSAGRCNDSDLVADLGATDAWLEPAFLDCDSRDGACIGHRARAYWLGMGETVVARWNRVEWQLGECTDAGPRFPNAACELCANGTMCPLPDGGTGTVLGRNAPSPGGPQAIIASFEGAPSATSVVSAQAFGWAAGCRASGASQASLSPGAASNIVLILREGRPLTGLTAQIGGLSANELMGQTVDSLTIRRVLAATETIERDARPSGDCVSGFTCFTAGVVSNSPVWEENFSPSLHAARVAFLRAGGATPSPVPECVIATTGVFAGVSCDPQFSLGGSRCYADRTSSDGDIDFTRCRGASDPPDAPGIDMQLTPTYSSANPQGLLKWIAVFRDGDARFGPPPNGADLVMHLTVQPRS